MGRTTDLGRWTRVGVLLLVAQLAAAVLPAVHSHAPADTRPHAEAPGTPHQGDGGPACHVCRIADARFIPAFGAGIDSVDPAGTSRNFVAPDSHHPSRQLLAEAAPRPPPLA
jgi:hypothetical protein